MICVGFTLGVVPIAYAIGLSEAAAGDDRGEEATEAQESDRRGLGHGHVAEHHVAALIGHAEGGRGAGGRQGGAARVEPGGGIARRLPAA